MDIKNVVVTAHQHELQEASEVYSKNQSATNWQRLEDAMWALQYVSQRDAQELEASASVIPVGRWPASFADMARRRANP